MDVLTDALTALVASDRPGRSVPRLCRRESWEGALALLAPSTRVAIVTGFFVPAAGAAETDGPGGAAVLARALALSGRECLLFTDPHCLSVVDAASRSIGSVPVRGVESALDILRWRPDLVIFVERLGRAEDGCFYNMRGQDISSWTSPLDLAASLSRERNIPVLAIGDGGNEVGMGTLRAELTSLIQEFRPFLCDVAADVVLPVDVSNWGAYALATLLSAAEGRWLGHLPDEEEAILQTISRAGAVDGVTLRPDCSVDGFALDTQRELVGGLETLWQRYRSSNLESGLPE